MWVLRFVVLGLLLAVSFGASARSIRCDNCTSTTRIYKAKGAGPGTHYLYDLVKATTHKVQVTQVCEVLDGRRTCYLQTWFPTPEPAAVAYFARVARGSYDPVYVVDGATLPGNGYELAEFPQLQWNTGTYIKDTGPGLAQDFFNFVGAVGSIVGLDTNIEITVRAVMTDGSTALYVYNHVTQRWELVPGSIKDSEGNPVPQNLEGVAGPQGSSTIYTFTNPNNWVNFNVRVIELGGLFSGTVTVGPTMRIRCSNTPSGVVCVQY